MKCLIVLLAFVAAASASHLAANYAGPIALQNTGSSSQFRSEDNYGNYRFGYDESHATGGSSRREEQLNGVRTGSYSLSDADGRQRTVDYIADAAGFRASVRTNEPGVEPKDPAYVSINKAAPIAAIAAPAIAAPAIAPAAPIYPAPAAPILTAPHAAPVAYADAPAYVEAPAPRAFSYSFGTSHAAPTYAAVAPLPAPIYQQQRIAY